MVGVPSRSAGCKTCRARKVKCDQAEPECQRCQKAGYVCELYERDFPIVDQTQKIERKFGPSVTAQKPYFRRNIKNTLSSFGTPELLSNSGSEPQSSSEPLDELNSSVTCVTLAPFQADICMSYLFKSLLHSQNSPFQRAFWRSGVEWHNESDALAHTAIQSLATTYFGRMHGNNSKLLQQGTILYSRALRMLREKIGQPGVREVDIMLASLALYLLEIVVNTNETAWLMHAGGVGRLMECRGPEAFRFQPLHDYFLFCRQRLVSRAMVTRKQTFLEQKEWHTVPWMVIPKTPLQEVMDIESLMPGIAEKLDLVEQNGPEAKAQGFDGLRTEELIQSIKSCLVQSYGKLVDWRQRWEKRNPESVFETTTMESKVTAQLDRPDCVQTVYYYTSPELAKEILTYHVTRTSCLYFTMHLPDFDDVSELFENLPEHTKPDKRNPLILPFEDANIGSSVIEVMRSIDYCVSDHDYRLDMLALLVPALRMCMLVFYLIPDLQDPKSMAWLAGILGRLADETGLEFYRRMIQMPPVGFYEDETAEGKFESYSLSNPQANLKKVFLPIRPGKP